MPYMPSKTFSPTPNQQWKQRWGDHPPGHYDLRWCGRRSRQWHQRKAGRGWRRAHAVCAAHQVPEVAARHHEHAPGPNQCRSAVIQRIAAPLPTVWSVVRRCDKLQAYKHFVKSCRVIVRDGNVGTLRGVRVVSGLPAVTSTERLEILDDEQHVLSFRVVDGEHRLANYRSVTTLHPSPNGYCMMVVELYVVDVHREDTRKRTGKPMCLH